MKNNPFGDNPQLEQEYLIRIKAAKALGWTEVSFVYDDMHRTGIYLGGVNPDGKWDEVPDLEQLQYLLSIKKLTSLRKKLAKEEARNAKLYVNLVNSVIVFQDEEDLRSWRFVHKHRQLVFTWDNLDLKWVIRENDKIINDNYKEYPPLNTVDSLTSIRLEIALNKI